MLVTALVTIIIFLVMITLHEFGHFIMAKAVGVKVFEFAVGMGPAIFKKQGKSTLYSVRAFPVGGYCSLEGEDEVSDSPTAFNNQKLWKRFLVVSAGALLNLILGFVLFMVIVASSGSFASNTVEKIDERSYIGEHTLKPGDKIVEINGHKISFYDDMALYTSEFSGGESFEIEVKRGKERLSFTMMPSFNKTTVTYSETGAEYLDEMNGIQKIQNVELENVPEAYVGKTFTTSRYIIGFEPRVLEVTAFNIVPQAWNYTKYVTKSIYTALWEMISGRSGLDNVSGPVGVAEVVGDAVASGTTAKESTINILFIVAMLTINLGIFNLLPLPALDGGRLLFMIIELARGKSIPPEKEGMVHAIGLMLLLALAAVIFFNDILKIIT